MVAMDDSDADILYDPAALSQIPAIPVENTIAYVNQAALVMVQHMNRFSAAAEEKLYHISTSITRLETELAILEGKLSSIPGLDAAVPKGSSDTMAKTESIQTIAPSNLQFNPPNDGSLPTAQSTQAAFSIPTPVPREQAAKSEPVQSSAESIEKPTPRSTPAIPTAQNDPVYSKYFKMLNVGVPLQAVKLKMKSEGLNPDVLDTPNAPSQGPPSSSAKPQASDSGSSAPSSDDE